MTDLEFAAFVRIVIQHTAAVVEGQFEPPPLPISPPREPRPATLLEQIARKSQPVLSRFLRRVDVRVPAPFSFLEAPLARSG